MTHQLVQPSSHFKQSLRILLSEDRIGDLVAERLPIWFGSFESIGVEVGAGTERYVAKNEKEKSGLEAREGEEETERAKKRERKGG